MEYHFGGTVKRLRENAGLTQRELSVRMDVHATQIGQWEQRATFPYKRTVKLYSRAFNVTEEFLRGLHEYDCIVYPWTEDEKDEHFETCPMCGYNFST